MGVAVFVGVLVGVAVSVGVDVSVGVAVFVDINVLVGVLVDVEVGAGDGPGNTFHIPCDGDPFTHVAVPSGVRA